jgi:hypothetical protein
MDKKKQFSKINTARRVIDLWAQDKTIMTWKMYTRSRTREEND